MRNISNACNKDGISWYSHVYKIYLLNLKCILYMLILLCRINIDENWKQNLQHTYYIIKYNKLGSRVRLLD